MTILENVPLAQYTTLGVGGADPLLSEKPAPVRSDVPYGMGSAARLLAIAHPIGRMAGVGFLSDGMDLMIAAHPVTGMPVPEPDPRHS